MSETHLRLVPDPDDSDEELTEAERLEAELRKQWAAESYDLVRAAIAEARHELLIRQGAEVMGQLLKGEVEVRMHWAGYNQKLTFEEGGLLHKLSIRSKSYGEGNQNSENPHHGKVSAEPYTDEAIWFDELVLYFGPKHTAIMGLDRRKARPTTTDLKLKPTADAYRGTARLAVEALRDEPTTYTKPKMRPLT